MSFFTNFLDGFAAIVTSMNLVLLLCGVLVGMLVGVIPGLGPTAGIAILLPLTFGLDPVGAMVMLAAIYYGSMYGGTITSVLINTPGESATVATTFDGYPMAKKGRAGPALVIAAIGSFVAGIVGAVLIGLSASAVGEVASSFGPPEMFLLVILGLGTLILIVGENKILGIVSALLGFMVATVGVDMGTGAQRFTFGLPGLIDGVEFVAVAVGMFGVGEVFWTLFTSGRKPASSELIKIGRLWPTKKDIRESRGAIGRGSIIGFVIGALPGAGATIASFISYSVEKAVSKRPQEFGKGAIAGVAGPETANNAASMGAMVPMLSLGIPGSASTAVLLGGFVMWGLQPGPLLMTQHPVFAWGLIASMLLGNLFLLIVNIGAIPIFAKISMVPFPILAPFILALCMLGTYAVNSSWTDVIVMLVAGVAGFLFRLVGMSSAAFIIAVVLGPMAEDTLRQTMIISNGSFGIFLQRLPSIILVLLIGAIVVYGALTSWIRWHKAAARKSVDAPAAGVSAKAGDSR